MSDKKDLTQDETTTTTTTEDETTTTTTVETEADADANATEDAVEQGKMDGLKNATADKESA